MMFNISLAVFIFCVLILIIELSERLMTRATCTDFESKSKNIFLLSGELRGIGSHEGITYKCPSCFEVKFVVATFPVTFGDRKYRYSRCKCGAKLRTKLFYDKKMNLQIDIFMLPGSGLLNK